MKENPQTWTSRLTYAVVTVVFILLLRHHAPDEAARARYQKKVYNIIDDVLKWSPKLAVSGMMEKQHPVVNAIETNHSTGGTKAARAKESPDDTTEFSSSGTSYDDDGADQIIRESSKDT